MAQLVKCLTLNLASGYDLTVYVIKDHVGLSTGSTKPAWDSFFLPSRVRALSLSLSLSLSQNK